MKIMTTRFGQVDIGNENIIEMPYGMLGFADQKRYAILKHKDNSPFFWYQSIDKPGLAFVLTSPFFYLPDYHIDTDHIIAEMSWSEEGGYPTEIEVYVIVNIPQGEPEKMTVNLIGPILINQKIHQAVQMIIAESPYSHKFPLIKPSIAPLR